MFYVELIVIAQIEMDRAGVVEEDSVITPHKDSCTSDDDCRRGPWDKSYCDRGQCVHP